MSPFTIRDVEGKRTQRQRRYVFLVRGTHDLATRQQFLRALDSLRRKATMISSTSGGKDGHDIVVSSQKPMRPFRCRRVTRLVCGTDPTPFERRLCSTYLLFSSLYPITGAQPSRSFPSHSLLESPRSWDGSNANYRTRAERGQKLAAAYYKKRASNPFQHVTLLGHSL